MIEPVKDAIAADVAELMTRYSFDLGGYPPDQWIEQWLSHYTPTWLPIAVIEALYQGRYKAVSIWQILDLWRRRGKPLQHFNREFERMVSGRTIQLLFAPTTPQSVITVVEPLLVTAEVNGHRPRDSRADLPHRAQPSYEAPRDACPHISSSSSAKIVLAAAESTSPQLPAPNLFSPVSTTKTPIQTFKPSEQFKLVLPGEMARLPGAQYPIRRFVPAPDSSEFHSKLKSIVQVLSFAQAQTLAERLATKPSTEHPPELKQPEPEQEGLMPEADLDRDLEQEQPHPDQVDS